MAILKAITSFFLLSGLTLTSAHPHHLPKRQSGAPKLDDLSILQFALTLEHLEAAFYKEGFEKFPAADFLALGVAQADIDGLVAVGETEATHVKVLSEAITAAGGKPVSPCTYDFKFTDAKTMVATAKVLEAVGVSAYLGAAPLVENKDILSAAASIVTVESRHQTLIRKVLQEKPVPTAFDAAVGPLQVFTLAASFIKACPPESDLGLTAFPKLDILNAAEVRAGSVLQMENPQAAGAEKHFCSFTNGDKATQFVELVSGGCEVPKDTFGEVFVVITKSDKDLTDDVVVAGPAVLSL